jgi:hypothetical protein
METPCRKDCSQRRRCGRLSTNLKLKLYKALIRSVLTCACPTREHADDAQSLKFERLQNRALHAVGCSPARELHVAFKITYLYEYITQLCRKMAEVILNPVNRNICAIGQGEAKHKK